VAGPAVLKRISNAVFRKANSTNSEVPDPVSSLIEEEKQSLMKKITEFNTTPGRVLSMYKKIYTASRVSAELLEDDYKIIKELPEWKKERAFNMKMYKAKLFCIHRYIQAYILGIPKSWTGKELNVYRYTMAFKDVFDKFNVNPGYISEDNHDDKEIYLEYVKEIVDMAIKILGVLHIITNKTAGWPKTTAFETAKANLTTRLKSATFVDKPDITAAAVAIVVVADVLDGKLYEGIDTNFLLEVLGHLPAVATQ
jgi:hypothetical protein